MPHGPLRRSVDTPHDSTSWTKVPADRNILDIHDQETSSVLQESCTRQNVLQCSVADDAALESAHLIPATQMKKDKQSDELYK